MHNHFWGAVLGLSPFLFSIDKSFNSRFVHQSYIVLFIALSVVLFGVKKPLFKHWALIGGLLVYEWFNRYTLYSMNHYVYTLFLYIWSMAAICLLGLKFNINIVLKYIFAGSVIQVCWLVLGYFGIDIYGIIMSKVGLIKLLPEQGKIAPPGHHRIVGSLSQPTLTCSWLAITSLTWLRFARGLFWIPIAIIMYLETATGVVAFFTALIFYIFMSTVKVRHRLHIFTGLASIALLGVFYYGENYTRYFSSNVRLQVWQGTMEFIKGWDWVFGQGLGYFRDNFTAVYDRFKFNEPHNEYLFIISSFGLIWLCVALIIVYRSLLRSQNNLIGAMLVSFLVSSLTLPTLHVASIAILGVFLLCYLNHDNRSQYR